MQSKLFYTCMLLLLVPCVTNAQLVSMTANQLDGDNGFTLNGVSDGDNSGIAVSTVGDVNADGIDDFIIGASRADPDNVSSSGSSYVIFGNESGFPNPFNLSNVNGLNGFIINSNVPMEQSGQSVSAAGDVNGDGIDDLIIGAASGGAGKSYVVFGRDTNFPNPFNLSTLNGLNGIVINGESQGDLLGTSVSSAGDLNDDGIDDLIIGAPSANGFSGKSYVIYGADSGLPNPFNLSIIDGINGVLINGINHSGLAGASVSNAGDVNGDNIDDIVIGASLTDSNNNTFAGSAYVVFGSQSGLQNPLNLSDINGINGFVVNGENQDDRLGVSVSSAGDFNGDGIDDLIMGAHMADPNNNLSAGSSYVIYGNKTGFPHPFNVSSINGINGVVINGEREFDSFGISVNRAGDVNGDGVDDLIIGAPQADLAPFFGIDNTGKSYFIFGSKNGLPSPINVSTLNNVNGVVFSGVNEDDISGYSVSYAGDVNNDGFGDVVIGAYNADPNNNDRAGSSFVVFGSDVIFKDKFE